MYYSVELGEDALACKLHLSSIHVTYALSTDNHVINRLEFTCTELLLLAQFSSISS